MDFQKFMEQQERVRRPWLFLPQIQKKKGKGRGHWGHKGRPGRRGGSLPSGETAIQHEALTFVKQAILSPGMQKPLSKEAEAFLIRTVKKKSYTAYRGHGLVKHKAARYTNEEIETLNSLKPGDKAPDFLTAKRKNEYPSYSKKRSVARAYSEGRLSIILEATIPAASVLVDLENLANVLGGTGQTILDQNDFDYFRTDKEILVKGPVAATIHSIKGNLAVPRR